MGLFTPIYMRKRFTKEQLQKALGKVKRITDTDKLIRIAREATDMDIRLQAAIKSEDIKSLVEICRCGNENQIKNAFFVLKYGPGKRRPLDREMAEIAIHCPDSHYAREAADVIRDEEMLMRVATEAGHESAARAAVRSITDQKCLLKLAKDGREMIRGEAVERLKDSSAVSAFAQDPNAGVRVAVAKHRNITDVELHERMALEDPDPEVRRIVILNPQGPVGPAALAKVLLEDPDPGVRKAAAESPHCSDKAALARALLEEGNVGVRRKVAENCYCTDPETLSRAALEDPDNQVRQLVLIKPEMKDEEALTRIAADKEQDRGNRIIAIRKGVITDKELLSRLALDPEESDELRIAAIAFVDDPKVLEELTMEKACLRRWATLRLARIEPKKALEPVMKTLREFYADDVAADKEIAWVREAINFMKTQFLTAKDQKTRKEIASLSGRYGWSCVDHCGNHGDEAIHMDLKV